MRRHLLFCALGALLGCRSVSEPSGTAIALFCSTYQGAKTESLTVGEEVAVFACSEGTEDYFLEAAKFLVGSDGRSLTYASAVYYPDPKQAVRFLAYFPFGGTWDKGRGTFSVPTDQSTAKALKEADLCGAVASTTPVATPVALEFKHLMARVVVTTNEPTTKITFPNALASGVLHAATAEFVLGTERKGIWTESTTNSELIVPVQPLSRLVLTVSGVEYVFDTAPIALEAGKTTTLDLTLHPNTKTATLSGSSVTDWGSMNGAGNPSHAVSNVLTLHWPSYLLQGATPDQVVFTIGGTDYTVASGVTYANKTFTVPFASSALRYPYTISKIAFYRGATPALPSCADLLGSVIYKSGALTVGIKDFVYNSVLIDDLWWATGNLIASNAVAGEYGQGGCTVGDPMDGGLYFQFGSLIGYKGGNQDNGGTGVGMPKAPLVHPANGNYWNGVGFSWASDAMVWPTEMTKKTPLAWPANNGSTAGDRNTVVDQWFFNYNSKPYSTGGEDIRGFELSFTGDAGTGDLSTGRYAVWGIGDPCTYYLGGTWRLPKNADYTALFAGVGNGTAWGSVADWDWQATPPGAKGSLFFPASGYRGYSNGSFISVTTIGYGWSSLVSSATYGHYLGFDSGNVYPRLGSYRSYGFPVRCVSPAS